MATSIMSTPGTLYDRSNLIETRSTATTKAMNPRNLPRLSNFSSSGVFGVSAEAISLAILPNSVDIPVLQTTPTARPDEITVPM